MAFAKKTTPNYPPGGSEGENSVAFIFFFFFFFSTCLRKRFLSLSLRFSSQQQRTSNNNMSPTDALQVVDADANFDERAAARAAEAAGLPRASDGRYGVVAVMGPQSSGKSTLLNAMVRRASGLLCRSR